VTQTQWIACYECNRGGNGKDLDKCACGWQIKEESTYGCYLGERIKEEDYDA
jgi:hypothetical protein